MKNTRKRKSSTGNFKPPLSKKETLALWGDREWGCKRAPQNDFLKKIRFLGGDLRNGQKIEGRN
ncbi:hypothetical protein ABD79_16010 [Bacillus thuringiensis]|nr:hypothetical protein [Bacillus thuringiensis]